MKRAGGKLREGGGEGAKGRKGGANESSLGGTVCFIPFNSSSVSTHCLRRWLDVAGRERVRKHAFPPPYAAFPYRPPSPPERMRTRLRRGLSRMFEAARCFIIG